MNFSPTCSNPECSEPGPRNRWENLRAQKAGWFFQRNGDMFCPKHVPEWVEEWRAKKAAEGNK